MDAGDAGASGQAQVGLGRQVAELLLDDSYAGHCHLCCGYGPVGGEALSCNDGVAVDTYLGGISAGLAPHRRMVGGDSAEALREDLGGLWGEIRAGGVQQAADVVNLLGVGAIERTGRAGSAGADGGGIGAVPGPMGGLGRGRVGTGGRPARRRVSCSRALAARRGLSGRGRACPDVSRRPVPLPVGSVATACDRLEGEGLAAWKQDALGARCGQTTTAASSLPWWRKWWGPGTASTP